MIPRQARLDAPGLLQHVMARGIEGREIFGNVQKCLHAQYMSGVLLLIIYDQKSKYFFQSFHHLECQGSR